MTISEMSKLAYSNSSKKGFHEQNREIGTSIALIHSELSEALEADRNNRWADLGAYQSIVSANGGDSDARKNAFDIHVKNTFEDELADAIIRIGDLCGSLGIDIEKHVVEKMKYNKTRPYLHGKSY